MKELIPILECLGINNAISLDDDHNQQSVRKSSDVMIENILLNSEVLFSEEEKTIIYDSGIRTVNDAMHNDAIPEELKNKLSDASNPPNSSSSLEELETYFENTSISFKKITKIEKCKSEAVNNAIWFLDKEIDGANILGRAVAEIMGNTADGSDSIIVVFTKDNSLEDLNISWDKRYRYLKEELELDDNAANELAYSFFVVSKTAFLDIKKHGVEAAIRYLSNVIIDSLCGFCIKKTILAMEEMQSIALHEVETASRGITKDNSELFLFNNMISEGEHNLYYHLRALHDLRMQYEYINRHEDLWKYVACMKMIAEVSGGNDSDRIISTFESITEQFDWTHLQFINTAVNKEYADISYGDVYELKTIKPDGKTADYIGILITQPCDCILRNNETFSRKAKNLSLLLFKVCDFKRKLDQIKTDLNKLRRLRNWAILIEKNLEERYLYINAEKSEFEIKIAPFILDLTSLNNEGRAIILDEDGIKEKTVRTKISGWKTHMEYIKRNTEVILNRITEINDTENADKFIGEAYGIEFSSEEKEFSIRRIGCMDKNITNFIVSHFASNEYRIGKPSLLTLSEEPQ